jgi:hypothetical protein
MDVEQGIKESGNTIFMLQNDTLKIKITIQ